MSPKVYPALKGLSFAEILTQLGGVSPDRVRLDPTPGRATEEDVDRIDCHADRLFELIDGILVEKVYDIYDSLITTRLTSALWEWNEPLNAGLVNGPSAPFRFGPQQVRMPDATFTSWERLPDDGIPRDPVPNLVPNLAVEVVNPANSDGELSRKRQDYFAAGVELVWFVYSRPKFVEVYLPDTERTVLRPGDVLDGGDVLPGFTLPVAKIFEKFAPTKKAKKNGKK